MKNLKKKSYLSFEDRQIGRQTDRQTQKETERDREREIDRDRQTDRKRDRDKETHTREGGGGDRPQNAIWFAP